MKQDVAPEDQAATRAPPCFRASCPVRVTVGDDLLRIARVLQVHGIAACVTKVSDEAA